MSSEKLHHRSSWLKTGLLAGGMYFGIAAGETTIGNLNEGFRHSANAEAKSVIHQCRDQVECTLATINEVARKSNTCATGKPSTEKSDYRPLDTLSLDGHEYEIGTNNCNYAVKQDGVIFVLKPAAKDLDPMVAATRIKEGIQRIHDGRKELNGLMD